MSKKEKEDFIRAVLSEAVSVRGVSCKVMLCEMFTRYNNAVVVLKRKNGTLFAIGI